MPRFVVPLLFWFVAFYPAIVYSFSAVVTRYDRYRETNEEAVLFYLVLCLCMFWVGFTFTVGSSYLQRATRSISIGLTPRQLRSTSIFIVTATFAFLMFAKGYAVFVDAPYSMGSLTTYIFNFLMVPLNVLAMILYGLTWPERGSRIRPGLWVGAIYVILMGSIFLFSIFSRSSGMMPLFLVLGYIGRWRRIPWIALLGATAFSLYGHRWA